jgi:hypothetical protein
MQMKLTKLYTVFFMTLVLGSCNKTEGEGGTSSIQGKIWVINLNAAGETVGEYYAMDQDVFIMIQTPPIMTNSLRAMTDLMYSIT